MEGREIYTTTTDSYRCCIYSNRYRVTLAKGQVVSNVPVKSKAQHNPPGIWSCRKFLFKSPLPGPKSCSNAPTRTCHYLRLRISNCHTQIKTFSQRLSQTTHKLREMVNNESFDTLLRTIKLNGKHNGEGSVTTRNFKTSYHVLQRTEPTSRTSGSWTSLIDLYSWASIQH